MEETGELPLWSKRAHSHPAYVHPSYNLWNMVCNFGYKCSTSHLGFTSGSDFLSSMTFLTTFLYIGGGLVISWLLVPQIIRWSAVFSRRRETKQFHHTHTASVPRFGGLALAVVFTLAAISVIVWFPNPERATVRYAVLISGLAMFTLGFIDDFRPLGAKRKLLGQLLIALGAYYFGLQINSFKNPITQVVYDLGILSLPATVIWLVALTNLINLIDGIDGLAGGVGLMLMALLMYVGFASNLQFPILISAALCGALLGFLYFNFPPAKIYLGDGGAYFLGFLIAALTIVNSHKGTIAAALIAPICALALPIVDVSLAILRRGLKGLPIFRPDRKHIHHRLQDFGHSRRRTVLLLWGISLAFLVGAFGIVLIHKNWLPVLFGLLFLVLMVMARSLRFSWDWFSAGRVFGNSLEMRKEIQYVLQLGRLLELEAERCDSIRSLWDDFKYVAGKLDFSEMQLTLDGVVYRWKSKSAVNRQEKLFTARHELNGKHSMTLEFAAPPSLCSDNQFELMSELLAESWLKATTRWQAIHERPLVIEPDPLHHTPNLPTVDHSRSAFPKQGQTFASAPSE